MNPALAETVLSVLSAAEPQRAALSLTRFRARDWQRSLFWLDASGLALHLLHALRECSAEEVLPDAVLSRLRQKAADNAARTRVLLEEFATVNRALASAGIRFAALKGFTLVPEYCRDPALRQQVDLDYLVAPGQMKAVAAAVRPLGYQWVLESPFECGFATIPGTLPRHEDTYRPPVNKTLEFHFRLFDRAEFPLQQPDDALERAHPATRMGVATHVLDAEDQFLYQALHAFQHILVFSMRLSWLLELATAVRARHDQTTYWETMRDRTKGWDARTGAIVGLVLALAKEMFDCEIPAALRAWTIEQCPPAIGVWVRDYGRRWALRSFPGNKLSLLVTRELMDRSRRGAYARASILPFHRPPQLATASGANGSRRQAQRMQRRYVAARVMFHLREALRLGLAWPGWMWRRRCLSAD